MFHYFHFLWLYISLLLNVSHGRKAKDTMHYLLLSCQVKLDLLIQCHQAIHLENSPQYKLVNSCQPNSFLCGTVVNWNRQAKKNQNKQVMAEFSLSHDQTRCNEKMLKKTKEKETHAHLWPLTVSRPVSTSTKKELMHKLSRQLTWSKSCKSCRVKCGRETVLHDCQEIINFLMSISRRFHTGGTSHTGGLSAGTTWDSTLLMHIYIFLKFSLSGDSRL